MLYYVSGLKLGVLIVLTRGNFLDRGGNIIFFCFIRLNFAVGQNFQFSRIAYDRAYGL